ncbi:response regulator [Suttonella sp. R2A3]|uniref:hybrid sensor histidine kinase/response regulator n=1 Tax=Suttonella sp. R2A3 TaxID=2908648 RepID=UPI001F17DF05|nr:response regulator [Suttonella sp. R2A3]UJF25294.1 response regulator [Suttonella sp. R2A3]
MAELLSSETETLYELDADQTPTGELSKAEHKKDGRSFAARPTVAPTAASTERQEDSAQPKAEPRAAELSQPEAAGRGRSESAHVGMPEGNVADEIGVGFIDAEEADESDEYKSQTATHSVQTSHDSEVEKHESFDFDFDFDFDFVDVEALAEDGEKNQAHRAKAAFQQKLTTDSEEDAEPVSDDQAAISLKTQVSHDEHSSEAGEQKESNTQLDVEASSADGEHRVDAEDLLSAEAIFEDEALFALEGDERDRQHPDNLRGLSGQVTPDSPESDKQQHIAAAYQAGVEKLIAEGLGEAEATKVAQAMIEHQSARLGLDPADIDAQAMLESLQAKISRGKAENQVNHSDDTAEHELAHAQAMTDDQENTQPTEPSEQPSVGASIDPDTTVTTEPVSSESDKQQGVSAAYHAGVEKLIAEGLGEAEATKVAQAMIERQSARLGLDPADIDAQSMLDTLHAKFSQEEREGQADSSEDAPDVGVTHTQAVIDGEGESSDSQESIVHSAALTESATEEGAKESVQASLNAVHSEETDESASQTSDVERQVDVLKRSARMVEGSETEDFDQLIGQVAQALNQGDALAESAQAALHTALDKQLPDGLANQADIAAGKGLVKEALSREMTDLDDDHIDQLSDAVLSSLHVSHESSLDEDADSAQQSEEAFTLNDDDVALSTTVLEELTSDDTSHHATDLERDLDVEWEENSPSDADDFIDVDDIGDLSVSSIEDTAQHADEIPEPADVEAEERSTEAKNYGNDEASYQGRPKEGAIDSSSLPNLPQNIDDSVVEKIAAGQFNVMGYWLTTEEGKYSAAAVDHIEGVDQEAIDFFMYEFSQSVGLVGHSVEAFLNGHLDAVDEIAASFETMSHSARLVGYNALGACAEQYDEVLETMSRDGVDSQVVIKISKALHAFLHVLKMASKDNNLNQYQGVLLGLANFIDGYRKSLAALPPQAEARESGDETHKQDQSMLPPAAETPGLEPQTSKLGNDTSLSGSQGAPSVDDQAKQPIKQSVASAPSDVLEIFVNEIEHYANHPCAQTLDRLIEASYGLEETVPQEASAEWMWSLLDAIEQLLLAQKTYPDSIDASYAPLLRQASDLIDDHHQASEVSQSDIDQLIGQILNARHKIDQHLPKSTLEDENVPTKDYDDHQEQQTLTADEEENADLERNLTEIFIDEADDILRTVAEDFAQWRENMILIHLLGNISRKMHTLKGSSRTLNYSAMSDLAHAVEQLSEAIRYVNAEPEETLFERAFVSLQTMLDQVRSGYFPETDQETIDDIFTYLGEEPPVEVALDEAKIVRSLESEPKHTSTTTPAVPMDDRWDTDLLETFADEAQDLLTHAKSHLSAGLDQLDTRSALQRITHTLKGSARMVGLDVIGTTAHLMESVVDKVAEHPNEPTDIAEQLIADAIESQFSMLDSVLRFEVPQKPEALDARLQSFIDGDMPTTHVASDNAFTQQSTEQASALASQVTPATFEDDTLAKQSSKPGEENVVIEHKPTPPKAEVMPKYSSGRSLRVEESLLEKLTTMVGEANVLRSVIENTTHDGEVTFGELQRIVTRIDAQMRRLESESEAQMQYRRDQTGADKEFDPLEMDRFTEMQQLSRQLSETVDDLKNVQDLLLEGLSRVRIMAVQQGVLHRGVQDHLMEVQLVRFDAYEGRLRRLVAQAAKSVGKEVRLKISGGHHEIEHKLLDDLLGPLEHIIRNSIAHGIEAPDQRLAAKKRPYGTITIEVDMLLNELALRIVDDGRGFDYDKIRQKARNKGWLDESRADNEQYLNTLLLRSGMSTATNLTQLSGRGIGLDVVSDIVHKHRGQISLRSFKNKGAEFNLTLSSSMSVIEVLQVSIAGQPYVIPMTSLVAVAQIPVEDLRQAISQEEQYFHYRDDTYRVRMLGQYFGHNYELQADKSALPVLLVQSSGAHESCAFHIDHVISRLEIVIKSVHPLVQQVPGVMGATVLADGGVVPVLDLQDLARQIDHFNRLTVGQDKEEETKVLIVDDSITMRKVGTRLLERNGFKVATAKDGLDALDVLFAFEPDIVLLDIEMPRMDGLEFASRMRDMGEFDDVPIIMITSRTGHKHRERAAKIGVQGYLGKPYNEDRLLERIYTLLSVGVGV